MALSGLLVFLLPVISWTVRNAHVTGAFPVLSTIRGQTLYGGNNPVVANELKYWGYWVFPNDVPGETPLVELSRRMNEVEVDRYYTDRAMAYVREHAWEMPRLLLGKLVRAYLPVPWNPLLTSYVAAGYRMVLLVLCLVGVFRVWGTCDPVFRLAFGAMALTNVATVLVFYGYSRFAFPLDAYLLVFAGPGLAGVAGGLLLNRRQPRERRGV